MKIGKRESKYKKMNFLKNKDKKKNTEEKAYKKDQRSKLFNLLIFFYIL